MVDVLGHCADLRSALGGPIDKQRWSGTGLEGLLCFPDAVLPEYVIS